MSNRLLKTVFTFFCLSLVAACTSTSNKKTPSGGFNALAFAVSNINPEKANACIVSAANKYYLPTRVIKAVDTKKSVDGTTQVILKVDVRDAVCIVGPSGNVRSVIDTTAKSAEQALAEKSAVSVKSSAPKP